MEDLIPAAGILFYLETGAKLFRNQSCDDDQQALNGR